MATPYTMSPMMQRLLGTQKPIMLQGVPAAAPAAAAPPEPALSSYAPNLAEAMAAAALTNGNNSIENPESVRRQYLLAIQRNAARQAADQQAQAAIADARRMQWLTGQRTLADAAPGAQLTPAYYNAMANYAGATASPRDGVVNGVAYRGGMPVGYAGAVPGMDAGIPEGGFSPEERQAFANQLMDYAVAARRPMQMARNYPVSPASGAATSIASSPPPAAPMPARADAGLPVTSTGVPNDTPSAALRAARDKFFAPSRMSAPQPVGTIAQKRAERENVERGMESRKVLDRFQRELPTTLEILGERLGGEIDEAALANQIIADNEFLQTGEGERPFVGDAPIVSLLPQYDPKVLLRWAQDYLKARKVKA